MLVLVLLLLLLLLLGPSELLRFTRGVVIVPLLVRDRDWPPLYRLHDDVLNAGEAFVDTPVVFVGHVVVVCASAVPLFLTLLLVLLLLKQLLL